MPCGTDILKESQIRVSNISSYPCLYLIDRVVETVGFSQWVAGEVPMSLSTLQVYFHVLMSLGQGITKWTTG